MTCIPFMLDQVDEYDVLANNVTYCVLSCFFGMLASFSFHLRSA
jgi:hypothetical protein